MTTEASPLVRDIPALDRRFVTAALMLVMMLAATEQTITSTAMPTIIGELHGFEHYAWVASIYLLASTVSMPLYGRLADAWGRKRVLMVSIAIFCVASLLAASAHSMLQLIVFRGIQGLGAGGIMPVVLTILGDIFTLEERAKIQGLFSALWGISSLGGPVLGAFLVQTMGWRSIFFVNLPFGLLGVMVLSWKYHDREKPHSTDLDLPGVLSLSTGCMALLAFVSLFGSDVWHWWWGVALIVYAAVSLAWFVRHERTAANPIIPPALLANRNIGPSLVASLILGIAIFGIDVYVPLYVQGGLGGGVGAAALAVTPVILMWAVSGVVAAPLIVKWGFRKVAFIGSLIVLAGLVGLLACALSGAPRWLLTITLAFCGFGFGPASMSYLLAAQHAVAWQRRGIVTSGIQFFRTSGGAVGIGLLGALFNLCIRPHIEQLKARGITPHALLDPEQRAKLPADVLHSVGSMITGGLLWVFAVMVGFAVVCVAVSSMMSAKPSDEPVTPTEAREALAG